MYTNVKSCSAKSSTNSIPVKETLSCEGEGSERAVFWREARLISEFLCGRSLYYFKLTLGNTSDKEIALSLGWNQGQTVHNYTLVLMSLGEIVLS